MKIRGDKNSILTFESQSVSHAVLPQLQLKSCNSVMRVIFSSCSHSYVIRRWCWIYLHIPFPRCTPASLQIDLFTLRLSGLPRHKRLTHDKTPLFPIPGWEQACQDGPLAYLPCKKEHPIIHVLWSTQNQLVTHHAEDTAASFHCPLL